MKRILLTAGSLVVASVALAKGSDTILEKDPHGGYVMLVSFIVVVLALVGLTVLIHLFARFMVKSARKKAAQTRSRGVVAGETQTSIPRGDDCVVNGEIIAAIALAVCLNKAEMHDSESDVLTINKVARVYSPWSSKIHGLTRMPERIKNK